MNSRELEARLKWSRKRMKQRFNKPIAKHSCETLGGQTSFYESLQMKSVESLSIEMVDAINSLKDTITDEDKVNAINRCLKHLIRSLHLKSYPSELSLGARYFSVNQDGNINDDNFDFDVQLRINGDFRDLGLKKKYAQLIADALNNYGTMELQFKASSEAQKEI